MDTLVSAPQKVGRQVSALQTGSYTDIGWLSTLNGCALVVCRIVLGKNQGGATGFLIGKDLIMTNNHVLDSLEMARGAKAHFFYTKDSDGVEVALNPDNFFYTSPTPDLLGFKPITKDRLDFTLVSIHSHPKITEVCHLAFSIFGTPIPKKESAANIIHHPLDLDGISYQKVSFRENLIKESSLFTIHYTTTTLPGSSGSPVIDDEGNLIALHRATCTHILKALLREEMLSALLATLFPGVLFVDKNFSNRSGGNSYGKYASVEGSPLYVFSEGELKGLYYHQGKTESPRSLFLLIATRHTPAKEWTLQFLNNRLDDGEKIGNYHKECNTAVPIKAIRDHLKKINLLGEVKLRYEARQRSLSKSLKESYLEKCASLPLLLTNTVFSIESFFTQLSIVSHISQEKKEEEARQRDPHLMEKDSLREIYARLCTTEKLIELNNLFDSQQNKPIKRVLVLGRAGIGKSTLCQKVAYDWATGTLFNKKFKLVYSIRLRDFNSQKKFFGAWLSQMIAESCYDGAHQEKIHQELQTHPEKILLVFDGWDEASPELIQALETYFLQTQVHCLLTSRPGVTAKIHGNFDLIVENMGFSRAQVEIYIEKFFAHTQCPGVDLFLKILHSRSHLLTITHIPIQLQILCSLWQKGEKDFPQTLTPLFSKIVHHLFAWEQNKNLQKEKLTPLKRLFLYQALGEISLKGLESKQLIISLKLVEETLIEKSLENSHFENIRPQDLFKTGLVKECGANNEIYFLHLTYQEYSIAYYISSLPKSSLDKKQAQERQRTFIQTYRYKPHFHLVVRMLAGCMWEDSNKDIKTLETFFDWLYDGYTDLIGAYQTELVLACLDECQSVELEQRIWEKYKIGNFVESILEREAMKECLNRLTILSRLVFTRVVQHVEKVWGQETWFLRWFFQNIYQYINEERTPKILNLMQKARGDRDGFVPKDIIRVFQELATYAGKENLLQILHELQTALVDQDSGARQVAAEVLGKLAAYVGKENIPQILSQLKAALRDQDKFVRSAAIEAIGEVAAYAEKESTLQILNEIQKTLWNQSVQGDWVAAHTATHTLGKLARYGGQESISQILNEIQGTIKRDRGYSFSILPAINVFFSRFIVDAGRENIPPILNWIQTAFREAEPDVRSDIVRFFEDLAAHVGKDHISQILNLIQEALLDQSWWVRRAAFRSINNLTAHAQKETLSQILKELQPALEDPSEGLSEFAIEILETLGMHAGKENISQILNALQTTLKDQNKQVRATAIRVFGKLIAYVRKENISQILDEFQAPLTDQSKEVRLAVVKDLKELAAHIGKEHIPHILNGLLIALTDQEKEVCSSAAEALGELAAQVGKENISQIFHALQTALRDHEVHRAAAQALRKFAAHVKKEYIPQILEGLLTTLIYQDCWVNGEAIYSSEEPTVYAGKENIPQILNWIQIALNDREDSLRKEAALILGKLVAYAGKMDISQILNWIQTHLSGRGTSMQDSAMYVLGELSAHAGKENIPQILNWTQIALTDQNDNVRVAAVIALKYVAAHAENENISHILKGIQTVLSNEGKNIRLIATEALEEMTAYAGEENISQTLNVLQIAINDDDYRVRFGLDKTFKNLVAHADKESVLQILNWIQTGLSDQEYGRRSVILKLLEEFVAQVKKENTSKILNMIQTALQDQYTYIRKAAVQLLGVLATHAGKEEIPQVLEGIRTALRDEDKEVYSAAIQAACSLKTEWLLPIFISQPPSYPEFIPILFDHFINHSIPFYFIEKSSSIHTSETCYATFDPQQLEFFLGRSHSLLKQTWKKPKEPTEEHCNIS